MKASLPFSLLVATLAVTALAQDKATTVRRTPTAATAGPPKPAEASATPRRTVARSDQSTRETATTRKEDKEATPKSTPAPKPVAAENDDDTAPATVKVTPAPVKATPTPAKGGGAPTTVGAAEAELDVPAQAAIAFFSSIQKGQIEEAYTVLTKGSKIAERPEELKTLKAKTTEAVELFGAIHGYEQIESKPVGHNLLRRTYISLGRDYPLRWRFYFYRSAAQWRLVDLRVDDRLAGIFDEDERPNEAKVPAQ